MIWNRKPRGYWTKDRCIEELAFLQIRMINVRTALAKETGRPPRTAVLSGGQIALEILGSKPMGYWTADPRRRVKIQLARKDRPTPGSANTEADGFPNEAG